MSQSGPADVEIVVPAPGDVPELAQVSVQAWRETYAGLLPERFYDDDAREWRRRFWSALLAKEDLRRGVRVAVRHGGIVGFVIVGPAMEHQGHPPVRDEQLFALYVLSSDYGQGVGQALLDHSLGARPAQLWVVEENKRAQRFYRKNGFVDDGTRQADPDLEGLVELRMVR